MFTLSPCRTNLLIRKNLKPGTSPTTKSSAQPYPQPATRYDYSAPFADAAPTMPSVRKEICALGDSRGGRDAGRPRNWPTRSFSQQDPYRTLDVFPTEKYLSDYQGVVGSRFRANLIVDAELGGSFEKGRILTFREETSSKSLAVLAPARSSSDGVFKRPELYCRTRSWTWRDLFKLMD